MTGGGRGLSPGGVLVFAGLLGAAGVAACEHASASAAAELSQTGQLGAAWRPAVPVLRAYAGARAHVLTHWHIYLPAAVLAPGLLFAAFRGLARSANRAREAMAGMRHEKASYALPHPLSRETDRAGASSALLAAAIAQNPDPDAQVVLGFDGQRRPVYLSDRARSMHVHLLGQTGSGKTASVIYPLLYQDICRGRPVVFLDAKGSVENEQTLTQMAAAAGRLGEARIFTLNPARAAHSYNPLYLAPGADPRAAAERVFSTFAEDMDNPYYRNTALEVFSDLVCVAAGTGKQANARDLTLCLSDADALDYLLGQSSDRAAVRRVRAAVSTLGDRFHQTVSGLRVALARYQHPALCAYAPDIVLEDLLSGRGIIGFSISANSYKFLARGVGLCVLQHLQAIGAARQQDRSLPQTPLYVYADEFYTFAYEGFVDAVNKLRDAHISMLLSHQSLADLDRVGPEYSRAVWDNCRNKVVLYQSDADLCERLAASVGTKKDEKLTVRRSADMWLNAAGMLEASSREVDEYILHPSQPKALEIGQCYLVQAGVADRGARASVGQTRVVGTHLGMLGPLPPASLPPSAESDPSLGLNLEALL